MLWPDGRWAEAEAECRQALAIKQKLADENPAVTGFRSSLGVSLMNLGELMSHEASRRKPRASTARR